MCHHHLVKQVLLADIYTYQGVIDDVRNKGQRQISRYMSSSQSIKSVIEKQLANVQSSYNALLNTALQIKVLSNFLVSFNGS